MKIIISITIEIIMESIWSFSLNSRLKLARKSSWKSCFIFFAPSHDLTMEMIMKSFIEIMKINMGIIKEFITEIIMETRLEIFMEVFIEIIIKLITELIHHENHCKNDPEHYKRSHYWILCWNQPEMIIMKILIKIARKIITKIITEIIMKVSLN